MKILLSKTKYYRREEYLLQTNIIKDGSRCFVVKKAMGEKAWDILQNTKSYYKQNLKGLPKEISLAKPLELNTKNKSVVYEFIEGKTLETLIETDLLNRQFNEAKSKYEALIKIVDSFKGKPKSNEVKGFKKLVANYINPLPGQVLSGAFVQISEITADHIIKSSKDDRYHLIDYEDFLETSLPERFIRFRSELYLINNLQQIIQTIACKEFPIVTFSKQLYIPKDWQKVNNFSEKEKAFYYFLEQKLQNYLNWSILDLKPLLKYKKKEHKNRISLKLDAQRLINYQKSFGELSRIKSSKFYQLWRIYNKVKETVIKN